MSPLRLLESLFRWIQSPSLEFLGVAHPVKVSAYVPWSAKKKAIVATLSIFGITAGLPALGFYSKHAYTCLSVLGIIYGILLAYPVMKMLKKKMQAGLAAFLGGLSFTEIGSKEAAVRTGIRSLAHGITTWVSEIHHNLLQLPVSATPADWTFMDTAAVLCVWMTIITLFLVVLIEAYFAWEEGKVEVSSTPAGAEVYVDSSLRGTTPATLYLKRGAHALSVKAAAHKDWNANVTVAQDSEMGLSVTL